MPDLRKSVFLSPYQGLATQGQVFRRLCHKGGPTLRRKAFRRLCHLADYLFLGLIKRIRTAKARSTIAPRQ